eukprot:274200-Hanusia_phi.AAC.1
MGEGQGDGRGDDVASGILVSGVIGIAVFDPLKKTQVKRLLLLLLFIPRLLLLVSLVSYPLFSLPSRPSSHPLLPHHLTTLQPLRTLIFLS